MPRMKVLVSGGGIAGTSLAFWLSKLGHDVTVVEWFPTLRATGLQLDLRGHGIEVLRRMGLEQAFRDRAVPEQGIQMVDGSGRRRAHFPTNKSGSGLQSFTSDFEIMRGDLCRLVYDASKDRTKYIFGTSVDKLEQKGDGVEVRFKDGRTEEFDLLVGADGQGSRTRKMMLGPGTEDAFIPIGGSYIAYFTARQPIKDGEEHLATGYLCTRKRAILTRRHSTREIQVYLASWTGSEELRAARQAGGKGEKEAMAGIFRGAGWKTDEFLQSMMDSEDFYCEHIGLVKMGAWSKGRVALVGDAAYCPSSMTGMGTTSAVVGAYVLAGEIGRHCGGDDAAPDGLDKALAAYEDKFRPFMNQVQHGISGDSMLLKYWPTTHFGISILYFFLGLVSFLRLDVLGSWVLRENAGDWQLPVYEEMLRD